MQKKKWQESTEIRFCITKTKTQLKTKLRFLAEKSTKTVFPFFRVCDDGYGSYQYMPNRPNSASL
jgi:hypothetical protein